MKKITLLLLMFCTQINYAQNTFPTTGNVGIGTTTPFSKLSIEGALTINGGLMNTLSRPSINAGTLSNGEIRGYSSEGNNYDDGFLRLSAGAGTTPSVKSYIDLSGYSTVPEMNGNIVFGTYGSERMRINSVGNVGIGTITPDAKLVVNGDAKVKQNLFIYGSSGGYTTGDNPVLYFGVNSEFAKISVPFGDKMVLSSYHGYTFNTSYNGSSALPSLTIGITGDVGIGTTAPDAKLAVNGTIHSKEVKVDMSGWPDYVFKKEYNLPTLEQVEKHIAQKGHLENIPSQEEVLKNGINLGEMNAKLLQKMEEMTLYLIEQEKKNKLQSKRIEELEKENKLFKSVLERVIKIEEKLK